MAHPDHDQVIGRLVGARLRRTTERRAGGGAMTQAHPDAESWAAYVDGGLLPAEVTSLDEHLSGCASCRRLVAALAPEVSAGVVASTSLADVPAAARATILRFPQRRKILAWASIAAALLLAVVTFRTVSWQGRNAPVLEMAERGPAADAAPTAAMAPAPASGPTDRLARKRSEPSREVAAPPRGAPPNAAPARSPAKPEEDKRLTDAARAAVPAQAPAVGPTSTPAVNTRQVPLQTNAIAGAARPHGPLATQAANQQQNAPAQQASAAPPPGTPATPVAVVAAPPPPAPAPAAAPARAQGDAGAARERRANEQQSAREAGQLTESVIVSGGRADAAASNPGAKDELAKAAFAAPLPSFAEPGGRLQWRIAGGRTLESSSDGGTTWNPRFEAGRGDRLRAGTAPAIDSAWAVGERGLVLRLSVPGRWTAVARPDPAAALVAVSATDGRSARVTAADGRVFETADGGATWTPAGGPQ